MSRATGSRTKREGKGDVAGCCVHAGATVPASHGNGHATTLASHGSGHATPRSDAAAVGRGLSQAMAATVLVLHEPNMSINGENEELTLLSFSCGFTGLVWMIAMT